MKNIPKVYPIYKPPGPTSFQMLAGVKRCLKGKASKFGHFGTLDPFAEGLMLIGVSGAARLNQYIQKTHPKTYVARGVLGIKTASGDNEGEVIEEQTPKLFKLSDFKKLLEEKFIGEYLQSPPAFSAAKHKGKALYKYAREGKIIEKKPVTRFIYTLEILEYNHPHITFKAKVSSGTYIRSLFEDMAQVLGTVGHLDELIRTHIGPHNIEGLPKHGQVNEEDLNTFALNINQALPLKEIKLTEWAADKFNHGVSIDPSGIDSIDQEKPDNIPGHLWVLGPSGELLGMGQDAATGLKPIWVLT